ncbi:lactate permease [Desulfovibrio sp. TomC]|uniref:lactate permease n=1 Tax=Desulfovibrio sp. TomC TaxID=1562888 RepID=UPI0005747D40|nr:lactate permease [Desulfovibrio sp. TomC]KHK00229.1 hypothetical protein NY78_4369 [Desulfovibrio sp. TomC]
MGEAVDRYKRQQELLKAVRARHTEDDKLINSSLLTDMPIDEKSFAVFESMERRHKEDERLILEEIHVPVNEINKILESINSAWDKKKINDLIFSCQRQVISSVVGPFGLGQIVAAYDKVGGNVDTIHNARSGIYATDNERLRYDHREEYDSAKYHSHSDYIAKNRTVAAEKAEGVLVDEYTGRKVNRNDNVDLDHTISASEIHNDPGRVLAEKNGPDAANSSYNLNATERSINRSKKHKPAGRHLEDLNIKKDVRQARIEELAAKTSLTDQERQEYNKWRKLEEVDHERVSTKDREARLSYEKTISREYYSSSKFFKSTLTTSGVEASKMGLQQAIGCVMVDFFVEIFDEVQDAYKNGFKDGVGKDTFFEALVARLHHVAKTVLNNWKNVVIALRDGAISGFLSNIFTTFINAFWTTAKRVVRMIREGFMSLIRAIKLLVVRPEGMTAAQASDAALKLLASGVLTGVGIIAEEYIEKALLPTLSAIPVLGSFGSAIIAALTGGLVGIASALVVYLIDKIDLFKIDADQQNAFVLRELDSRLSALDRDIEEIYDRAVRSLICFS